MRWSPFVAAVLLVPAVALGQGAQKPSKSIPESTSDTVDPWNSSSTTTTQGDAVDPWAGSPAPPKPAARATLPEPPKQKRRGPEPRAFNNKKGKQLVGNETIASFPGFARLQNGASRVWLEVNRRVDITEHKAQGRITYRLRGVNVPTRTNRLPLITGFFATPIDRITLVDNGPDADLVIDLQRPSEVVHRVVETPRGIVLQVDFPWVGDGKVRGTVTEDGGLVQPDRPSRPRARRGTDTKRIDDESAY